MGVPEPQLHVQGLQAHPSGLHPPPAGGQTWSLGHSLWWQDDWVEDVFIYLL